MRGIKNLSQNILVKCGKVVASFAFAFALIAANTSCAFPYYEPDEPANLSRLKKFNN